MILFVLGCADTLVRPDWDGGLYLEVTGPIEGDVAQPGDALQAVAIWAWVVDDHVGGAALPIDFEPEVGGYRLGIAHPPVPEPSDLDAPPDLQLLGDATLLVGSVVLVSGPDGPIDLEVEPVPTLDALVRLEVPEASVRSEAGFVVVAGWASHRLGALGRGGEASHLEDLPGWTGQPCELGRIGPGVALYDRETPGCAWTQVAPPGEDGPRTDIPLIAL